MASTGGRGTGAAPRKLPALVRAPELRKWVRMAIDLGPVARITGPLAFARDWEELRALARDCPGAPAVVEDRLAPPDGSAELGALVVPVSVAGLGQDVDEVEGMVLQSIDPAGAAWFLEAVDRRIGKEARSIMARLLSMAHRPFTVPEAGTALALSHVELARRCAALGIPVPRRLIALARIFTVERLADWSGQPPGAVAGVFGFSHPSNYRRLVRQVFGAPPTAVRGSGGARRVGQAVLDALAKPAGGGNRP